MNKIGFDNKKYVELQSKNIAKRVSKFSKLYLEFGGKLFDDYHASRVLPGFEPDSKIKMLLNIKEKVEIMLVISADDIERNKIRSDLGITYSQDLMRLIDAFTLVGLEIGGVVITHYNKQVNAQKLRKKLEKSNIKVAYHYIIDNYPNDIDKVLSNEGFGKNEYIKTAKDIVVVMKKNGIYDVVEKYNLQVINGKESTKIINSNPHIYNTFEVSKDYIDSDIIINLPKIKCHVNE